MTGIPWVAADVQTSLMCGAGIHRGCRGAHLSLAGGDIARDGHELLGRQFILENRERAARGLGIKATRPKLEYLYLLRQMFQIHASTCKAQAVFTQPVVIQILSTDYSQGATDLSGQKRPAFAAPLARSRCALCKGD